MIKLDSEHYLAVLRELKHERERLEGELSDVEDAITVIERLRIGTNSTPSSQMGKPSAFSINPINVDSTHLGGRVLEARHSNERSEDAHNKFPTLKYDGISVRWAILWLLSEIGVALPTSIIAADLERGGIKSKSASFSSNVSAVLSVMRDKGEVSQEGSGWKITARGDEAWKHIYRTRINPPNLAITSAFAG